ncbi:MAG: anaerobic ribonucleoside-triphosphate reductase activating protein [Bacilli bacterium]|nr:anaerobic ribonucleoside-triphosphate reductase activating protein [Bacilli bacterium]
MKIRLAADIQPDSIVDGLGIRTVIWTQGCSHNCKGCHNPSTHDFNDGFIIDVEELKDEISQLESQDGITFSGGDPMFQAEACCEVAKFIKDLGMNVWCYTGFTFEELLDMSINNKFIMNFLNNIDILVDGKFEMSKRSYDLKFRGSSNQRIIDVKKSLLFGQVEILSLDDDYDISSKFNFEECGVFV